MVPTSMKRSAFKHRNVAPLLAFIVMTLSHFCWADASVAPAPWDHPAVSAETASKVLYVPISHVSVTHIPIKASEEPLIDLLEVANPRIIPLASFGDQYRNTYDGYSKIRLGVYQRLLHMLTTLPSHVGIAYFEGFRPLSKQKEYFDKKFLEILEVIPDKEKAYAETTKHVSPFIDNIPTHATGAAIDITLFVVEGKNKQLMDMGKFDVIFGPNHQQDTFSHNASI